MKSHFTNIVCNNTL